MFVKLVLLVTFFSCSFLKPFSTDLKSARNSAFFGTHFLGLKKKLFKGHISTFFNFEAKRAKNQKTYFVNVS
jgi:hypothetical protein